MRKFIYGHAENAVKCGYELNRIALLLHLFMWFKYGNDLCHIFGVLAIVLSYTCVYFAESIRTLTENENQPLAEQVSLGTLIFTTGSFLLWLISTFGEL